MENQQAEILYKKYLAGNCTPEERALVEQWYLNEIDKRQNVRLDLDDESVKAEMWAELQSRTNSIPVKPIRRWYPYAAALALVALVAGLFYYDGKPKPAAETAQVVNEIKPGRNTATLTLADGKKIILSDAVNGQLAKQAGVVIRKDADGQLVYDMQSPSSANQLKANKVTLLKNILTTARGEEYQLILPDGSKVWLNAGSSLSFPVEFTDLDRRVELSGEAYFEISRNKNKPFIVKTGTASVEVLGTHFNVMSYQDEGQIKTTLLEGSVKIATGAQQNILVPGQQAVIDHSNIIHVSKADVEGATAWKNGYFKFDKRDIQFIMRQLSRWYNIEVVYEGEIPKDLFVGKIRRSENITEVLKIFELSQLKYQIKGRKVIIKT